jgi:hypothetical protein
LWSILARLVNIANKQCHVARPLGVVRGQDTYLLYNQKYSQAAIWLPVCLNSRQRPCKLRMGLVRLAKMLCTLLLLVQIFIPDTATFAADIQNLALLLSCAVFAFIVCGVLRDAPRSAKARKLA